MIALFMRCMKAVFDVKKKNVFKSTIEVKTFPKHKNNLSLMILRFIVYGCASLVT